MEATQIIMQSAQNNGLDPEIALQEVGAAIQDPDTKIAQVRDSVFVTKKLNVGAADLTMLTVESGQALVSSISEFVRTLKSVGIQKIYGDQENQELIQGLQQAGIQVNKSDVPEFDWFAKI